MNHCRASRTGSLLLALLLLMSIEAFSGSNSQPPYDVVILNGRVMDPETGFDAVRNVAVRGGKVVAISVKRMKGRETIDATGLVVAPGFIDLHQHSQTDEAYRVKALDGVTTALEMEQGVPDIDKFYFEREGKAKINFGATTGHEYLRAALVRGSEANAQPSGESAHRALTIAEIEKLRSH